MMNDVSRPSLRFPDLPKAARVEHIAWVVIPSLSIGVGTLLTWQGYDLASAVLQVLVGLVLALAVGSGRITTHPFVRFRKLLLAGVVVLILYQVTWGYQSLYVELSTSDRHAFNEQLSRPDALYLSLTVLTTTGFGDIRARSSAARTAVSTQMAADITIVALLLARLAGPRD
jgi:hypothetical protein